MSGERLACSGVCGLVALLAVLLSAAPARGASVLWLGDLPGGAFESRATGISASGATVVGASRSGAHDGQYEAFRWTAETSMLGLYSAGTDNDGDRRSYAHAVDATGTCVVGETTSPNSQHFVEAVVWQAGSTKLGGFLNGANKSSMFGVNDDCTAGVGDSRSLMEVATYFAIGASVQIQSLGNPPGFVASTATTIAGQASFVGGVAMHPASGEEETQAFRRTVDTPYKYQGEGRLNRLSADGTVGAGELAGQPARWTTNETFVALPLPPGFTGGEALGVSPNGKTLVGRLDGTAGSQAFVWSTALGGLRLLSELLAERGVALPEGAVLLDATGVAADESTIVGTGLNGSGQLEAYRVSLESPQPGARIAAGADFACALFDDVDIEGTLVDGTRCWGHSALATPPAERLIALAAGGHTACGLDLAGLVHCWGDASQGQHGLAGRAAREIRGGDDFMCIRNTADRLECTGGAPPELDDLSAIAISTFDVGDDHACVVAAADDSVHCAGPLPPDGRLEPPDGLRASEVFLGRNASCAIERDTRLAKCWGSPAFGQAANLDGTHLQGAGGPNHICAIQEPLEGEAGSLYCQGRGAFDTPDGEATPIPPSPVDGERRYTAVTAGGDALAGFTCALDVAGRPLCFGGSNANGETCPPGDGEDCDGIPALADNCLEVANSDQLDSDGDGVGDACDACEGSIDQVDTDQDGIPDGCDLCKDRALGENRACPVTTLYLVTPEEAAEVLPSGLSFLLAAQPMAATTAAGTTSTVEVFKLLLDCGQDTIKAAAGSFVVPTNATAIVGNNCDRDGCDVTDPDDRLGDTVDGANSTVITLTDPDRGTLAAGTVGFKFRNDVSGLCGPGQIVRLADVLILDNVPGLTPAFSLTGVTNELGSLLESDAPLGQEPELVLRGFTTEPVLTVKFRPQVGGPANETSVFGDAPFLIDTVRGSIVGAIGFLGCDVPAGTVAGLPKWRCTNSGSVPNAKLPQNLDYNSAQSYVLGPPVSTPHPLGVAPNQIFYSFQATFTTSQGSRRAFNPGALQPWLIGTVRTDSSGSPAYVTDKLLEVLGVSSVAVQTNGGTVAAGDSDSEASIKPGLDPDGDGRTENDKCPFVPDSNLDGGGRQSPPNPTGEIPNGIGNDCECGDVNRTFRVDQQDRNAIASFLIGTPPAGFDATLCNVSGAASFSDAPACGVEDVLEQDKNFQGLPRGIEGKCAAFTGAQ